MSWWHGACAQPDRTASNAAQARQRELTKPAGALGRLESTAIELAALQARALPRVDRVWIAVFAGDHGIAAEGVSAYPQVVTGEMLRNFARGGAAISVLARALGAELEVVDLGTVNDPGELPGVRRVRLAPSTANFLVAPALGEAQLLRALAEGAASVARARAAGAELYLGGEMGIGNSSSAAALACALLRESPENLAGRGTGLDSAGLERKRALLRRALLRHAQARTPVEILRAFAGFELAALCGAYIAAARAGLPVLVDGFIATAAALCAVHLNSEVRPWLLFAHCSEEQGHARLLQALHAKPLLDLGLRLGEASGAAVAVPLLRLACELHAGMATFAEAGVSEAAHA
ncbi:MAG: nicotinate-nucleotide--dimethylbenzimidazole phosphoribosyltransferase [Xanthomonadales bacterium]|nr:nicotinate-nucleotide--dimethylbenzimidazole phosphoribosyltransferase [Xanthomonadales bacterium]